MPHCSGLLGNPQTAVLSASTTPSNTNPLHERHDQVPLHSQNQSQSQSQSQSVSPHHHQHLHQNSRQSSYLQQHLQQQHYQHHQQQHQQNTHPFHQQPPSAHPSPLQRQHHPNVHIQTSTQHGHSSQGTQLGPDPTVMEFISKIGQIIIKARTVSPTLTFHSNVHPSVSSSSTSTSTSTSSSSSSSSPSTATIPQVVPQHSLETVLQDQELWRNNTPVHVNILHAAQHVLLERWVISFTPPEVSTAASPMASGDASSKSPYAGYSKSKYTPASPSLSASKDTTDLVLLLQSLYTQIRSLPLQTCLTSFDEHTKLTKPDLDYSVTSAHEEITQSRYERARGIHGHDRTDGDGDALMADDYSDFTISLKSTLPLEFVPVASLKVLNFEASHVQWGCIRVTGMYDESVGGRIAPENFQDHTKIQKKKHHRSKASSSGSQDPAAKLAKRQQRESSGSWTSKLSKTKAKPNDGDDLLVTTTSQTVGAPSPNSEMVDQRRPIGTYQNAQGPSFPIPSTENQFQSRLQELKRMELVNTADHESRQTSPSVLQESAMPRNEGTTKAEIQRLENMQAYQFPPPPSPPLSIPQPKGDAHGSWAGQANSSSLDSNPSSQMDTILRHQHQHGHSATHQGLSHPPATYAHAHQPISTSPLARVITRRRSSRLSIVMTCNDDSPDPTRSQSPEESSSKHDLALLQLSEDQDHGSMTRPQYQRRDSFHDIRPTNDIQTSHRASGNSPTRYSFLRRSSLNPSSFPHSGDLFGSLVGSYEESILSGRMSTLPSKPLMFTAQIGVLANQDYKDCPPKLRCPKHVLLEFPAVFYDYESSSKHQHSNSHSHSHFHLHQHYSHSHGHGQGSFQHSFSSHHPPKMSSSHSFGHNHSFSQSFNSVGSLSSSPVTPGLLSTGITGSTVVGSFPRSIPSANDDPILPYVGNLDLDNGLRGERRFARMPGGMRIPLRGQVQVVIKNPNKTAVKVFLVPYDFTDMPPGTKTFLRQKHYSTSPGIGSSSGTQAGGGGTLRYAIHLQFCCPAAGYVFLYRSIRVVFANRVPDGKESLRVVMEGLGMNSRIIQPVVESVHASAEDDGNTKPLASRQQALEDRYVKMRKGEVMFNKKRKESSSNIATPITSLPPINDRFRSSGIGLGLNRGYDSVHPHQPLSHISQRHASLNYDGESADNDVMRGGSIFSNDMDVDMNASIIAATATATATVSQVATASNTLGIRSPVQMTRTEEWPQYQLKSPKLAGRSIHSRSTDEVEAEYDDDNDYRSISSSVLIGTPSVSSVSSPPTLPLLSTKTLKLNSPTTSNQWY
ncbi:hypothetical protein BG004_008460 [Podila humilis]|nr:hypothetical protein BG004_008460 [Podila humilis]